MCWTPPHAYLSFGCRCDVENLFLAQVKVPLDCSPFILLRIPVVIPRHEAKTEALFFGTEQAAANIVELQKIIGL
jgi:hypothetical protein